MCIDSCDWDRTSLQPNYVANQVNQFNPNWKPLPVKITTRGKNPYEKGHPISDSNGPMT